jgi:hypothetical protein
MAGVRGEIRLEDIRADHDHSATLAQNSQKWKCLFHFSEMSDGSSGRRMGRLL